MSVTSIGCHAFWNFTGLTTIESFVNVTRVGVAAFRGCQNLATIKSFDNVTHIGRRAFVDCNHLTTIENFGNVISIDDEAFRYCDSLKYVTLPPHLQHVGREIFCACTSLKEIYYKRGTKIGLKSLTVGNNAKLIPYDELPSKLKAEDLVAEFDKPDDTEENVKSSAQVKPSLNLTPPPTQMSPVDSPPPAETNCTVYRNTKIDRAESIAPPNTKSLSRVDGNIAEIRKAAELAAMNIVMTIERNLGFTPVDVSSQNLGYDIESTSPDGKISRLIEVKGRHIDAETVTVSRNEIDAALNNPDNFILAIVKLDADKNETTYLKRPFEQPPDRAALSINFSIQKLVEASQIISR